MSSRKPIAADNARAYLARAHADPWPTRRPTVLVATGRHSMSTTPGRAALRPDRTNAQPYRDPCGDARARAERRMCASRSRTDRAANRYACSATVARTSLRCAMRAARRPIAWLRVSRHVRVKAEICQWRKVDEYRHCRAHNAAFARNAPPAPSTLPLENLSSRPRQRSSVLLPHPLGPVTNSVSPARTENDKFSNNGESLPGTVCARRSTVSAFALLCADGDARALPRSGVFEWTRRRHGGASPALTGGNESKGVLFCAPTPRRWRRRVSLSSMPTIVERTP